MKTSRILAAFAAPALLLLAGCSGGKGESVAKQLCDCHEAAGNDISKKSACLSKQMELQKEIQNDASEYSKYMQKLSGCKAAFGG